MLDILKSAKQLIKLDAVCIDNYIFRLHYKATVIILFTFSMLVTMRQYIGEPIKCGTDGSGMKITTDIVQTYCWISGSFTLENNGTRGRFDISNGVGPVAPEDVGKLGKEIPVRYQKYYQWVCFVLFFQAVLFYIPRYIWKIWEGGRIKALVLDLNMAVIVNDDQVQTRKRLLVEFFQTYLNQQNYYAYRFFVCEVLNLINVFGQMFLMNKFLDGEFSTYGSDVVRFSEMDHHKRYDAMARVFPKVTKCIFYAYGPSGSPVPHDVLCLLPINVINEKIYVFLWFWFIILFLLSVVGMVYRIATSHVSRLRRATMRAHSGRFITNEQMDVIANKLNYGDWFVLCQLSKNINSKIYTDVVSELALRIQGKSGVELLA